MEDIATALMELRRQAQLQGRPLSEQEMAGVVAQGVAEKARLNNLGEQLALARKTADQQYKIAKKQMARDKRWLLPNVLGNLGTIYAFGKQGGLWGPGRGNI
jgi:hypothetical protein